MHSYKSRFVHTSTDYVQELVIQTCKSYADPGNSAFFDISRVILEIRPDPRRKHFINRGWVGPEQLNYKMCSLKRKIYILGYIFRAEFKLKQIISYTNSINKLYLFQINDVWGCF